jgi:hypothetical protein
VRSMHGCSPTHTAPGAHILAYASRMACLDLTFRSNPQISKIISWVRVRICLKLQSVTPVAP